MAIGQTGDTREKVVDALANLLLLRLVDDADERHKRLFLMGELALLMEATGDELAEAFFRSALGPEKE